MPDLLYGTKPLSVRRFFVLLKGLPEVEMPEPVEPPEKVSVRDLVGKITTPRR